MTGFVVFAVGVEQGIVLAIVLSVIEIIRRAYRPSDFVVAVDRAGRHRTHRSRSRGTESLPG